ncbi:hypothetical protein NW768_008235 [Fusarium equiseti]|uniref:Uncharacterized protein n=1 Tax=Fusarium equiseti TaxID=61235 RepID=A0ABQ8R6M7_FUSEQ|nr:hypothetical protein NW768_008235 [Fusarium equiseti]
MPSSFTFVNVCNAPGLGPQEAKQMRGHVTKTNFAKRRQRLAKASRAPNSGFYALFNQLPFGADDIGGSSREAEWVNLVRSEPALIEASISIALQQYPGNADTKSLQQAVIHKGRAIQLINRKLGTPTGLADGLLSAVFTLTYAELRESDMEARSIHMQGLAQMIRLRQSSRDAPLASWFRDFLLYDSLARSMLTADPSHQPLIEALLSEDNPKQMDIKQIRHEINNLGLMIDNYHASSTIHPDTTLAIKLKVERLRVEINTFLGSKDDYVRSLHDSLQLYLLLLWPTEKPKHLSTLAEELRYLLLHPHPRLCSSTKMLIWQLFVGAVAAGPSAGVRSWFVTSLREVLSSRISMGLEVTMWCLTQAFTPDARLMAKFQAIWHEVSDS